MKTIGLLKLIYPPDPKLLKITYKCLPSNLNNRITFLTMVVLFLFKHLHFVDGLTILSKKQLSLFSNFYCKLL